MKQILKFILDKTPGKHTLVIPSESKLMDIQLQHKTVVMWLECFDWMGDTVPFYYAIAFAGDDVEEWGTLLKHEKTIQDGDIVRHIYIEKYTSVTSHRS